MGKAVTLWRGTLGRRVQPLKQWQPLPGAGLRDNAGVRAGGSHGNISPFKAPEPERGSIPPSLGQALLKGELTPPLLPKAEGPLLHLPASLLTLHALIMMTRQL